MDEQVLINTALVEMNTVWHTMTSVKTRCTVTDGWEGTGDDGLLVYVFPARFFCRAACCSTKLMPMPTLYSVHPLASKTNMESKESALKIRKAWFLSPRPT